MADEKIEKEIDENLEFEIGGKKKKKKKKDETSEPAAAPAAEEKQAPKEDEAEELAEDPTALFKDIKKKKKKVTEETDKSAEPAEEAVLNDEFLDVKKKKKKKAIDLDAFERELEADGSGVFGEESKDDFSFSGHSISEQAMRDAEGEAWVGLDRDYTYKELLDRAFRIIRHANPEMDGGKKRYVMIPPQVVREGTKKTLFANFADICKRMHRQPDHVIAFLFSELGTTGSVDGSQRLVIKGRFQPTQVENVLKSYILEYVTCKICRSPDTVLTKENRLTFIQCQACGAKRSVASIKSGFSAQTERRNR